MLKFYDLIDGLREKVSSLDNATQDKVEFLLELFHEDEVKDIVIINDGKDVEVEIIVSDFVDLYEAKSVILDFPTLAKDVVIIDTTINKIINVTL